jgi:hypothetical protein
MLTLGSNEIKHSQPGMNQINWNTTFTSTLLSRRVAAMKFIDVL